jgi:hypothetical protein
MGSRYGARQASKKTAASIKLMIIKNLRKKVRSRVTINAIYPIKWSLTPPVLFIIRYECSTFCSSFKKPFDRIAGYWFNEFYDLMSSYFVIAFCLLMFARYLR